MSKLLVLVQECWDYECAVLVDSHGSEFVAKLGPIPRGAGKSYQLGYGKTKEEAIEKALASFKESWV